MTNERAPLTYPEPMSPQQPDKDERANLRRMNVCHVVRSSAGDLIEDCVAKHDEETRTLTVTVKLVAGANVDAWRICVPEIRKMLQHWCEVGWTVVFELAD